MDGRAEIDQAETIIGRDMLAGLGRPGGYADQLAKSHFLREKLLVEAIGRLGPSPGSRGLDAGCGIGLPALLLARAVGPSGRVVGLDASEELLDCARRLADRSGLAERLDFRQGDINHPPFEPASFDWLISIDCAGYAPSESPAFLIENLTRLVRPGGWLAVMAWTSQQLLPGHPELEARLNATRAGLAPFRPFDPPSRHFLNGLGWFRQAGLDDARAKTLIGEASSPLSPDLREALLSLFDMRWGRAGSELPEDIRREYEKLVRPDSPGFILDRTDYYAFFTYTLFQGRVPAR
ncbi:MAG: class I SAM-dependent methyltransferase [Proteobacteria bacterium]|nr:class I SAM-dependent methyltransferase [Pseudomonadota bacterium]